METITFCKSCLSIKREAEWKKLDYDDVDALIKTGECWKPEYDFCLQCLKGGKK